MSEAEGNKENKPTAECGEKGSGGILREALEAQSLNVLEPIVLSPQESNVETKVEELTKEKNALEQGTESTLVDNQSVDLEILAISKAQASDLEILNENAGAKMMGIKPFGLVTEAPFMCIQGEPSCKPTRNFLKVKPINYCKPFSMAKTKELTIEPSGSSKCSNGQSTTAASSFLKTTKELSMEPSGSSKCSTATPLMGARGGIFGIPPFNAPKSEQKKSDDPFVKPETTGLMLNRRLSRTVSVDCGITISQSTTLGKRNFYMDKPQPTSSYKPYSRPETKETTLEQKRAKYQDIMFEKRKASIDMDRRRLSKLMRVINADPPPPWHVASKMWLDVDVLERRIEAFDEANEKRKKEAEEAKDQEQTDSNKK